MTMSLGKIAASLLVIYGFRASGAFLSHNFARGGRITARQSPTCYASRDRWIDESDDEVSYRDRYTGDSDDARELKNIRYETQDDKLDIVRDDYYYDDDEEEWMEEEDAYVAPRTIEKEVDEDATGNFWFNPKQGFDPLPSERQGPSRIEEETELHAERRPRPRPRGAPRKKTTFRSGEPKTPEPVAEFYDRLFWYGFNPDESIAPGDKTLFGGTKGKFNGLNFFEDDERRRRKPARRRKRLPQAFRADAWYDDIMDSLDNEYADDYDDYDEEIEIVEAVRRTPGSEVRTPRKRRSLPPEETYYSYEDEDFSKDDDDKEDGEKDEEIIISENVRRQPRKDVRTPRRRQPLPAEDVHYDEQEERYERRPRGASPGGGRPSSRRKNGDRVSNQVSSWFGPDDTDDEPESNYGRARRKPRRRHQEEDDETWSFTSILDGIFGVNREEVDMNAAMYNKQMGLDKPARSQRRPSRRRRPGQAYPYVEERRQSATSSDYRKDEDDLDTLDVVDVDAVIEDEEETKQQKRRRDRTIEDRAAAFERVPPSGVPAWGPTGAVGVDARTKATLDALEEIREATRKVELKEEQCIEAKEDIVVCKADFELQKKRLLASIDDPQQVRSRLRQMKMGVQDAAHTLRRSRAELEVARDRLADLEDRHWALLSLYDADKAFQEVVETFREFEESERLETRLEDSETSESDNGISDETKDIADGNVDETNVDTKTLQATEKKPPRDSEAK